MVILILNLLLCLISNHSTESDDKNGAIPDPFTTEELKLIDLPSDNVLYAILYDATDKVKHGGKKAYYTVWTNRYKDGTLVRVVRSDKDVFDRRSNILGYVIVNDCPVVLYRGIGSYPVTYAEPAHPLSFKLGRFDYMEDAVSVSHYYILEDIYARFSPEAGWIWSDGKPDE